MIADRQWASFTSAEEYLRDATTVFQHPHSVLLAQTRHRHDVVVAIASVVVIVPSERHGPNVGNELVLVYSVTDDRVLSAYMVSDASVITGYPGTIWLRK